MSTSHDPRILPRTGAAILRRITWRLVPFLALLYIIAYLDRINLSFAALQMNQDLRLGAAAYGLGAGLFFLGYVLFEVPSNLILHCIGPRIWIARIMVTWGLLSMAMALVRNEWSFYLIRFLLGVAEAGFFPGIILYLTYWFPAAERARAMALFATASALAGLIGSPISGALLELDGVLGWRGWHWLFMLEGLPAVLLGILVFVRLPNGPGDAQWLRPDERQWLQDRLHRERLSTPTRTRQTLGDALTSIQVWQIGVVYLTMVIGMYGIAFWLPQILRTFIAASDFVIGLLNAIPFFAATVGMVAIGWSSDRLGERRWHVTGALMLAAAGMLGAAASASLPWALIAFSIAAIGVWGVMGPFWAWSTSFLSGTAAAAGIALINSLGNTGGFLGPYLIGWLKQATDSYSAGLSVLAAILLSGSILALRIRRL